MKGEPYGKTALEVRKRIVGSALLFPGSGAHVACGAVQKPIWVFEVTVPAGPGSTGHGAINGALVLDAVTGQIEFATLPFLD